VDASQSDPRSGTPADYTAALYRVYFEVGEWQNIARDAIRDFLLSHPGVEFQPSDLRARDHGYEVDLPMQLIPEVVRALAEHNVAIYQVLRRPRE
jgi:hypothetical protein